MAEEKVEVPTGVERNIEMSSKVASQLSALSGLEMDSKTAEALQGIEQKVVANIAPAESVITVPVTETPSGEEQLVEQKSAEDGSQKEPKAEESATGEEGVIQSMEKEMGNGPGDDGKGEGKEEKKEEEITIESPLMGGKKNITSSNETKEELKIEDLDALSKHLNDSYGIEDVNVLNDT